MNLVEAGDLTQVVQNILDVSFRKSEVVSLLLKDLLVLQDKRH